MNRYSKNREAILECIRKTRSHPTAEWVYEQLKPEYPSLSLGTVYRNLNQLKEAGDIRSMGTVAGQEHFDGNQSKHHHALCSRCGSIVDLKDETEMEVLMQKISDTIQFDLSEIKFVGVCSRCKMEN